MINGEVASYLDLVVMSVSAYTASDSSLNNLENGFARLNFAAGSSATAFENGVRDVGRPGEALQDFIDHPNTSIQEKYQNALKFLPPE